jgi:hypothetical protein
MHRATSQIRAAFGIRATSAIVVGVLFLTVAAPAALASIPTRPVRACCVRGSHHSCNHGVSNPTSKTNVSAQCPCDNCERTLATPAARPQDAARALGIAPQFTYLEEFYGESAAQQFVQAQPQRAPPIYSIERMKSVGSHISSKLHRWTAAVWPL